MACNILQLKHPEGRELLGGDLLAQCLRQLGVSVAFGLHGGHLDAFLVGCVESSIELIDTRHETVAVQAAEGYAKVSGKTGCCFVTANSGFCNGIPGLATAFADRSPILCITSSPPLRDAETNALQGFHDQVVLAKPMTKFAHRVTTVLEIPRLVSLAWRTTRSGAPGPVLLDLPIDILFTPVEIERVAWGNIMAPPAKPAGPDLGAIDDLVSLLSQAERPALVIGTGAHGAVEEISILADTLRLPVFHSPKFSTTFSFNHALYAGSATTLGILGVSGQPQPDLIILLGARTGFVLGGRGGKIIPTSGCNIVQIDTDGSETGRSEHVQLAIISDAKLAIATLNSRLASAKKFAVPDSWVTTALSLKAFKAPNNESEAKIDPENGHLHPYHAMKMLFQSFPKNSILCMDGGECSQWAIQLLPEARAGLSMVTTGYLGFLGNGWGYSLGAAVADRSKLIINVQGDGSAGFHLAELDTFKNFNLNILTIVVNNSVWGMSLAGQDLVYGTATKARPASSLRPGTRYDIIAQGFGMRGTLVDATCSKGSETWEQCSDAIGKTVKDMTEGRGPGLIDLRVSPRPYHDATKAMVGVTKDPNVIVVPYYDNLPRPYFKEPGAALKGN